MAEIVIKSRILEYPVYMTIETEKSSQIYTSLCSLRNKLIENSIIKKDLRYKMYFYRKVDEDFVKIKEGDILEGIIFLKIEDKIDYSEPVNILYHLEKRITEFESKFKYLYEYNNYTELKKIWIEFRETNNDCFDYTEWYCINSPIRGINLLDKMSIDIRKWLLQKEKIIADIDLLLLDKLEFKDNEYDYDFISKFLYNF